MARSKRRCAISLHDVEKCTCPNCSSLTSWARTGWAPDSHAAAVIAATAFDDPMLMVSSRLDVASSASDREDSTPRYGRRLLRCGISTRLMTEVGHEPKRHGPRRVRITPSGSVLTRSLRRRARAASAGFRGRALLLCWY